jgi:2-polyprenyl-6-methoxyphenol hydroxylase-like FAD-dependent oxidoreductase
MIETHNSHFSIQLLTQPEHVFWFFYVKLDEPTSSARHYTEEEAKLLAAQYMDTPITNHTRFGDLWNKKLRHNLGNLEEGVQEQWYSGRIVLLGDAAHKVNIYPVRPKHPFTDRVR